MQLVLCSKFLLPVKLSDVFLTSEISVDTSEDFALNFRYRATWA